MVHRSEQDRISDGGERKDPGNQPPASRRKIMQANRRRDTTPELAVRSELHRRGLRYRVDRPIRVGSHRAVRPDLVFGPKKVAVFVDGCFWHGCPEHGTLPAETNRRYWVEKIGENRSRDARQSALLESAGWIVIRAWAHEDPIAVADAVESALAGRAA